VTDNGSTDAKTRKQMSIENERKLNQSGFLQILILISGSQSLIGYSRCGFKCVKALGRIIIRGPHHSLRQTVHTNRASVQQAAKLVAALFRVAKLTAGLAEINGSLPPGLRLTSPAG